ncbi:hypothetical protein [Rosenbergiella collisarenosi]|uniref:hypothetical protein n=1 Tax=Rosenbergiella collisarenosi TaxID=1544695 RepID=UPI001F4DC8CF|nr:hypothetical protein [Rosenbergiella collisarenosi]
MGFLPISHASNGYKSYITLRRSGLCEIDVNQRKYSYSPSVDVEVDLDKQLIRIKLGEGMTYQITHARTKRIQLPKMAISKILPKGTGSMVVELGSIDKGWFTGSLQSALVIKTRSYTERAIKMTGLKLKVLKKIRDGEPYLLRGDGAFGRKVMPKGKSYIYQSGNTTIPILYEAGYLEFKCSPLNKTEFFPIRVSKSGIAVLDSAIEE